MNIDAIKDIVDQKQYAKVDGVIVDTFTAAAMVTVYDALDEANQTRAETLDVVTFAKFAIKAVT